MVVMAGFVIFVGYERECTIFNERLRSRFGIKGNPIMAALLWLVSAEVAFIAYENDIRRRSGYYWEGTDLRWTITGSALSSMAVFVYAFHTFQQDPTQVNVPEGDVTVEVGNNKAKGISKKNK